MVPDMAVLVSSYQRPRHLERVLASIACQQRMQGRFEVVVTDDGSQDESCSIVEKFARQVAFPVSWTTHPHDGFQLARCRNEGVAASSADYLLFLDGDCLIPPDHLWHHWRLRRVGHVWAGYCACLDREASEGLTVDDVRAGRHVAMASFAELRKLRRMHWKALGYSFLRHPTKPKLYGGNVGIFREDYERINGYDENFRGWGCEDDDLRLRLRQAGMRIRSVLGATRTYHLWHPPGQTTPSRWRDGANVDYLHREGRQACCERGLSLALSNPERATVRRWPQTSPSVCEPAVCTPSPGLPSRAA